MWEWEYGSGSESPRSKKKCPRKQKHVWLCHYTYHLYVYIYIYTYIYIHTHTYIYIYNTRMIGVVCGGQTWLEKGCPKCQTHLRQQPEFNRELAHCPRPGFGLLRQLFWIANRHRHARVCSNALRVYNCISCITMIHLTAIDQTRLSIDPRHRCDWILSFKFSHYVPHLLKKFLSCIRLIWMFSLKRM